jgi:hypothetical protein
MTGSGCAILEKAEKKGFFIFLTNQYNFFYNNYTTNLERFSSTVTNGICASAYCIDMRLMRCESNYCE